MEKGTEGKDNSMSENQLLYLSQADVQAVGVTMAEVIESLEIAFREKGAGRIEMPPKPEMYRDRRISV